MIVIETNIVADDVKLWLHGNFYDSFGSIGNGRHLFCASEVRPYEPEVKWNAYNFVIFISTAHSFFCQPIKKFEFFGASRATRQRHFKTSSTGDENVMASAKLFKIILQFFLIFVTLNSFMYIRSLQS